jgi:hypothetical protein
MITWANFVSGSKNDGSNGAQKRSRLVVVGQQERTGLPIVKDKGKG